MFKRVLFAAILLHTRFAAAQDPIESLLAEHAHVMELDASGALSGPGGRVLVEAAREAQYVLVGEEHGIAEIPLLTAALFRDLVQHGYRHLAIETGDALATALNATLVSDLSGATYAEFLRKHWPGAPFYNWKEDAELLRVAVESAGGHPDVLWGLDYDILADRYAFHRLRDIAPHDTARHAIDTAIAAADSALERALAEQNPGLLYMFGGPTDVYDDLREAFDPQPGTEVAQLLDLFEETRQINALFVQGQGYESNRRRALLNRRQLVRYLDATEAATGAQPRVLFKFGATHMMRGRSFTEVFDLGTLAPELAETRGGHAFAVLLLSGAGAKQAVLDPRNMTTIEAPSQMASNDWAQPFYAAAPPDRWTLFDLRPLRSRVARLDGVVPNLLKVLYGYDAVVILGGSGPQHALEIR